MNHSTISGSVFRRAGLLVCCSFIAAQSSGLTAQFDDAIVDPESYAVFSAAVISTFGDQIKPSEGITLLQETRPVTDCPSEQSVPLAWRPVVRNHKNENTRIRVLRPSGELGRPYVIVSLAELRGRMRAVGYDLSKFSGEQSPGSQVFRSFPGGRLFAFSAVGFDEGKMRAIVTVQYDCFPHAENQPPYKHCHGYEQVALIKQEGKWVRARDIPMCGGIA